MIPENKILFLCDGRAECEQRFGCFVDGVRRGCCHTEDIRHARNFHKTRTMVKRSDGTEGPGFIWVENEPGAELRTLLEALDSNGGGEPKGETKAELDAFDFLRRNLTGRSETVSKKPVRWENTKRYREMRRGLLDNLESRGLIEPMYRGLVDEYMTLWVQQQQLRADVEEHGVTVKDEKRGMNVENRSVSLGVMVSRQMLQIYTALGFKEISGAGAAPAQDDDEL